jgi:cytidylate kinase
VHTRTKDDVARDLSNRDTIDSTRACSPLRKADDAVYLDTTGMSIDEVVEAVLKEIQK